MIDFRYQLIKICSRAGKEFYHVYPFQVVGNLPEDFHDLKVEKHNLKFLVVSFPDCDVTIFPSGRMLIESLPEGSDDRARQIVNEIIKQWQ